MTVDAALRAMIAEIVRDELARQLAAPAEHLTVAEYARRHSISQGTVRSAIREGVLPATKIGRAIRIPASAEIGRPVTSRVADATTRARLKLLGGSVR